MLQEPSTRKTRSALAALQTGQRGEIWGEEKYNPRGGETDHTTVFLYIFCRHLPQRKFTQIFVLFCFVFALDKDEKMKGGKKEMQEDENEWKEKDHELQEADGRMLCVFICF